jgi:hypothetical protein
MCDLAFIVFEWPALANGATRDLSLVATAPASDGGDDYLGRFGRCRLRSRTLGPPLFLSMNSPHRRFGRRSAKSRRAA